LLLPELLNATTKRMKAAKSARPATATITATTVAATVKPW